MDPLTHAEIDRRFIAMEKAIADFAHLMSERERQRVEDAIHAAENRARMEERMLHLADIQQNHGEQLTAIRQAFEVDAKARERMAVIAESREGRESRSAFPPWVNAMREGAQTFQAFAIAIGIIYGLSVYFSRLEQLPQLP